VQATEFIDSVDPARREDLKTVYDFLVKRVPAGYEEAVTRKMVVFQVPLRDYPDTYNGHPLWFIGLASEKSYLSLHLMPMYGSAEVEKRVKEGFAAAGKKLNAGKACIRFKKASDLDLETIGQIVGSITPQRWIEIAKWARRR
jgi:hypothetical protein